MSTSDDRIVDCVCCGCGALRDDEEQPECGHLFCYICLGRGHHEVGECIACERGQPPGGGYGWKAEDSPV